MKIQAIVHRAEEGGYWGEVPSIPGCVSQGETIEELRENLRDAIAGCLGVPVEEPLADPAGEVLEIAL